MHDQLGRLYYCCYEFNVICGNSPRHIIFPIHKLKTTFNGGSSYQHTGRHLLQPQCCVAQSHPNGVKPMTIGITAIEYPPHSTRKTVLLLLRIQRYTWRITTPHTECAKHMEYNKACRKRKQLEGTVELVNSLNSSLFCQSLPNPYLLCTFLFI